MFTIITTINLLRWDNGKIPKVRLLIYDSFLSWEKIVIGAFVTTMIWLLATFVTSPEDEKTLNNFVKIVNPGGPGWKKFKLKEQLNDPWPIPSGIILMVVGCTGTYGFLLGLGQLIYGYVLSSLILFFISLVSMFIIIKQFKNVRL